MPWDESDKISEAGDYQKNTGHCQLDRNDPFWCLCYGICKDIDGIVCFYINAAPNRKLIGYSFREQCRDGLPGGSRYDGDGSDRLRHWLYDPTALCGSGHSGESPAWCCMVCLVCGSVLKEMEEILNVIKKVRG